jgi:hypothetical protein
MGGRSDTGVLVRRTRDGGFKMMVIGGEREMRESPLG